MLNIHSPKEELVHAMDVCLLESIYSEKDHLGLEFIEHDGIVILNTGIHSGDMNGIFKGHTHTEDIVESIEYAIRYFMKKQIPYYWWVGKYRNSNLKPLLEEAGYEHVADLPVMVADLEKLPKLKKIPEIICKTVTKQKELEDWISISAQCIETNTQSEKEYMDYCLDYDITDTSQQVLHLAYWDGVPAASCMTFKGNDIATLYFIATLPEYRNRGLGRTITIHAMNKAKDSGYLLAGLQATSQGISLYENLGFTTISNEYIYALVVE
jgi:GNAT superfamily N-acetyltransferase